MKKHMRASYGGYDYHVCRLNPPVLVNTSGQFDFCYLSDDPEKEWCGQWEPAEPKPISSVYADWLYEQGEISAAEKLRNFDR